MVPVFALASGRGKLPVIRGIDVRLAHRLPRKRAEAHTRQHSFVKPSGRLTLDQSLAWGKYVRMSVR